MPAEPSDFVPEDVAGAQPEQAGPMAAQPGTTAGRARWAASTQAAALAIVVAGIWLIASIGPFSYEAPLNPVLCGLVLVAFAVLAMGADDSWLLALLVAAVGLWVIASPLVFDEPRPETVNLIAIGGIALVLAFVSLAAGEEGRRNSRG